ncbi:DoxX family protein [Actinopolymorpha rutila]|uniref:Putative membrane protein YphA (DoxX/SURF4 family) n=1 Tax=Actinopolymorpha rutila TaxID=446787 RepID=A0A852ZAF5_9ACTN|nr:DoxX family protein [Actinopolymorpha rutila]NYH89195.1 putative membrane protein YphA (DoxX/SURF4 family) [Actinopolymorpha rutila]
MSRTTTASRPAGPLPRTRVRWRSGVYWSATALVVGECAIGGAMDLLRMPPFYPVMIELGYPSYLATIMGTAKIAAAVVLLAPRLPRLKEWAYAGVMINLVGAIASNVAMHQPSSGLIVPFAFAGLALLSWALRPSDRRL